MLLVCEEDDISWDADECQNPTCTSGNCIFIRIRLDYQRKRNQHVRLEREKFVKLWLRDMLQYEIDGTIMRFKEKWWAEK